MYPNNNVNIQIELGFLMVGHTHEDIDQFFSKFSQYLQRNAAHTLPGNYYVRLSW